MKKKAKPERSIGRPSKYRPEFAERLHHWLLEMNTFDSFAMELDVTVSTLYEWLKEHVDFSEAKKRGFKYQENKLSRLLLAGATGQIKGYNVIANIFLLKARFRWSDDGPPLEDDERIDLEFKS